MESFNMLTREQLEAFVKEFTSGEPEPAADETDNTIEAFLTRHNIEITEKVSREDGSTMWVLKECPFNSDHVGTSVAVFQFADGKRGFKCHHAGCVDKHWKDFRAHFEPESIPERLNSPLPKVQLPGDNRLLSAFAADIAKDLKDCGIYRRGGIAMIVNEKRNGLEVVTPAMLRSLVEKDLVCYRIKGSGKRLIEMAHTMSSDDAQGVLSAQQFLRRLPKVIRIATARLPVLRKNNAIELLPDGYDRQSLTLTLAQCDYDTTMSLEDAKRVIDELFIEFPFADDKGRSKAVAVAAMVGLYAAGLLPYTALRPVFIVLANAEGAGKTLVAKCAVSPTHGLVTVDSDLKKNVETAKELLAAVIEARPYILFDNCKGHINAAALEAFVSAVVFKGRILGVSKMFEGENLTTVFITGNGATVSPDMRRRSLFVELFMEDERAEEREFASFLDDGTLLDMRPMILAALWAFVREWNKEQRPKPSRTNSAFPRWAQVIGGIVEHIGYGCPLASAEIADAADTDGSDMRELVGKLTAEPIKFDALVFLSRNLGLFERIIGGTGDDDLKPADRSKLGKLLKRYDRRLFAGQRRFVIDGKGRSRNFYVKEKP
jgi:hypothetical protein